MKTTAISLGLAALVGSVAASPIEIEERAATVKGFDISGYQSNVDFAKAYAGGARFVIIKATEGISYTDKTFSKHYTGATKAKLIRGAYHFAHPGQNKASAEAEFFVKHGGGWSKDGITLPGMVDLESEQGHPQCWGLSHSAMVAWIKEFAETYHKKTTRYPMLYTNPSWWSSCTGNSKAFKDTCPLVLARYASSPGTIPGGWPAQTIWQNSDKSPWSGDSDIFNGDLTRLKKLATG
ncbi:glycoside hydrolase, family 25, active site protein [Pochonia chlamydosporia 170]|uniref:N,O-diacetylmuramidase n=1 Tax=Pochonia chlamydosporia 170 TaxID=1380566 RepID=A0A179FJI1_METCM|nr:glycoside hydrolase, family 25, active site protein [Pochonia chlamydosporia 170]OAQ65183.1 glycoside hydrolase, family 25, active site protein [Pochonia chlamydosporia 170]